MEFRKIDSGSLKLKASYGNLSEFAKNVADSFKEYAKQTKVNLIFHSEPKSINLYFDTDKLEKILYNLLSNAFRFTPEGGKVELKVSEAEEDDIGSSVPFNNDQLVKITVSDSGKGIPAKDVKYIFERFYQVRNPVSTSNDGGVGIGLALTKNLVQLHKGTIRVKSEENKGTVFEILLPAGKSHLSNEEIIEASAESTRNGDSYLYDNLLLEKGITPIGAKEEEEETTPADEKLTLVLAEDNQELREYLFKYFSGKFNVLEANDGREALNICREHFPDVIVSDIIMPEMDGLEFCNSIKSDPETCHIPVILLTAKAGNEDMIKGLEHKADAYISKPFSPKALAATVNNLIENRRKLQEKYRRDILLEPEEVELESNEERLLQKAMKVVEENISNPEFNVNIMSREVGVSRAALYRKLKALTNLSVNVFVRNIRLKRAAQLLEQNKVSISEVAYLVGYNDVQYFRKCFTKQYNLTPSQYIDKYAVKTKK
jgi:DNA-binding response OmpR family regulator/two-component sensor histidine kinase